MRVDGRKTTRNLPDQTPVARKSTPAWAAELPDAWKRFAALEPGHPKTRSTALAELPGLLGVRVSPSQAHRAVHAVILGLAAGRWGKQGGLTFTTDRVLNAVHDVDGMMNRDVDPAFRASYERFSRLTKRALDHSGPLGLWGPTSIFGPIDNHPMNPSSLSPSFQQANPSKLMPLPSAPDLVKRTGEHHFELLAGNPLAFVGPPSALFWMLGANGNNGTSNFVRYAEGGAWKDRFGEEVTTRDGKPLFELYGEAHAAEHGSKDAFFGVEGTAKQGDVDPYRFESKKDQWVTIGCSQVTPGRRFAVELYHLDGDERTKVDRSEGIAGPAGIHAYVPAGRYEVVVTQLDPDPERPELTEHSVGRRLGPALMDLRGAHAKRHPDAVDQSAEEDENRYRLFVSGSDPVDNAPPDWLGIQQAMAASDLQEATLRGAVLTMEGTIAWMWPFLPPSDDTSNPATHDDPLIERFMRAAQRLDQTFFGQHLLARWVEALKIPGLAPTTVQNHDDR